MTMAMTSLYNNNNNNQQHEAQLVGNRDASVEEGSAPPRDEVGIYHPPPSTTSDQQTMVGDYHHYDYHHPHHQHQHAFAKPLETTAAVKSGEEAGDYGYSMFPPPTAASVTTEYRPSGGTAEAPKHFTPPPPASPPQAATLTSLIPTSAASPSFHTPDDASAAATAYAQLNRGTQPSSTATGGDYPHQYACSNQQQQQSFYPSDRLTCYDQSSLLHANPSSSSAMTSSLHAHHASPYHHDYNRVAPANPSPAEGFYIGKRLRCESLSSAALIGLTRHGK